MKGMHPLSWAACAAVLMATAAMAAQKATTSGAREGWAAAAMRCSKEPTEAARRECVNRTVREADLPPEVIERHEQRDRAAAQAPTPEPKPAAQPSPAINPEKVKKSGLATPDEKAVDKVLVVSRVTGQLVVRTRDNGAWRQTEGPQIRGTAIAGQELTITRTPDDGFTCSLPSGVSWSCERIN